MVAPAEGVLVTGLGVATSLGFGLDVNWERLLAGESAIAELEAARFALPIRLPVRLGAPLDREELARRIRGAVPRQVWNTSAEECHLWLLAAQEAMQMAGFRQAPRGHGLGPALGAELGTAAGVAGSSAQAGPSPLGPPDAPSAALTLPPGVDAGQVGVWVGNGAGAAHFIEQEYINVYTAPREIHRDISRMAVAKYMTSSLAAQLSILAGLRGPSLALSTACSSGVTALLVALDALRLGRVDMAIVGGVDMPLVASVLKGFANLGALSPRQGRGPLASRPFDAERDGFVLGEGAACLVLERESRAAARQVQPLARVLGGALTSEAHHLLSPREQGQAMEDCMRRALRDARLAPGEVVHVYSHGTGTTYNDRCEAAALRRVLAHAPTVSASKAQLGHTLGAAGAIDAVLAVQSLATGHVVPLAHLERLDEECPIQPARQSAHGELASGRGAVLVNSFAFGGHNATLVLGPVQRQQGG